MTPAEAIIFLGKLIQQSRHLCEVASTAKKGKQSLQSSSNYGRKFHAGVVVHTGILARLEPTFRAIQFDGAVEKCDEVRRACEVIVSLTSPIRVRDTALKTIELICHTFLEPALEETAAPSIPASEQILPMSVVKGTRKYIENVLLQTNGAYERGWFDAASVMLRKLVEIMIIEVYEAKGRAAYVKHNGKPENDFFMLSDLIDKILSDTNFNLARDTKKCLPLLKALGDRSAHNRRYLAKSEDVKNVIPGFRVVADDLLHLSGLK